MPDTVHVELAREVDREQLVEALTQRGLEARIADEEGRILLEIPCSGDSDRVCDEVLHEVESLVAETGLPLVPMRVEGGVYLRPPGE